jgi:alkylation response protein AidB-like acyl-CoA dehydrogenase
MNLTEPQAGSDVGALRTQAVPRGDGTFLIKGQKIYITFGEHDLTDNIVTWSSPACRTAPAGTKGISLFLVPKFRLGADGQPAEPNDVRCVSIEHKLGIHASPTCVMSYGDGDDCVGWMIGGEGGGMRAMFTMMNNARLNVGLQGVSIAERATQAAVAYAATRVQGVRAGWARRESVPIIQHPDVRRMLLRMKALTQAARALTYYAAGQVDRATLGDREAQMRADLLTPLVKAYGTDIGCEVASLGVQVHGGMGFVEETGAAQHYRDARIAPIYEGTNGIQAADLVGRKLGLEGGAVLAAARRDEAVARGTALLRLIGAAAAVAAHCGAEWTIAWRLLSFLTMLATRRAVALQRQLAALETRRSSPDFRHEAAARRFYLDQVVPEAIGLEGRPASAPPAIAIAVPEEAIRGGLSPPAQLNQRNGQMSLRVTPPR